MTSFSQIFKNNTLISTEQYWWYNFVILLLCIRIFKNLLYRRPWASKI